MLDLLLENFNSQIRLEKNSEKIKSRLKTEKSRLMDPDYLQREVIGKPRWAWDFESLDEGFMDLVSPFMEHEAGTSHLYLLALEEFGADKPEHENVIVMLEYAHYASLIDDYYNFNEAFAESEPDPRRCALLTQLKFAGQYMTLYPRHLVIRNKLNQDEQTLIRVHHWLKTTFNTWGISRGVMLKWLEARFNGVREEHYLQNSINALCTSFLFPIVMAAINAGQPEERVRELKQALSWLTLSLKMRCERRALTNWLSPDAGPRLEKTLMAATLPVTSFLEKGLALGRDGSFAMAATHSEMTDMVRAALTEEDLAGLEQREKDCFARFADQIKRIECIPGLVDRFAGCLGKEEIS